MAALGKNTTHDHGSEVYCVTWCCGAGGSHDLEVIKEPVIQ